MATSRGDAGRSVVYALPLDQPTNPTAATRSTTPSALAIWAGLITLYLVWGSTYLAIRVAIDTIPPYLMIAIRFFIAGGLLFAWSLGRGHVLRSPPSRREWRDSFIVGALLLCGGMGLVAIAEQTVPTGITALLIALMPAWVAVLGRVFFAERLVPLVVVGIVVGIVGVAVLVGPSASGPLDPIGLLAVLVSPILWGTGSLYAAHRATLPRSPLLATSMQMLCAGVGAVAIAFGLGEFSAFQPADLSRESLLALAYLVVIGSIVGFAAYVWLLRVAPLSKVTTYAYVNPVVAFVLGAIILGEPISASTLVAAAIIVFAVALIVSARGRESRAAERDRRAAEEGDAVTSIGAAGRLARPGGDALATEVVPVD